ncbi:MAG: hypothetical protein RLZZ371_1505 [Pseudomonadota bacterium]
MTGLKRRLGLLLAASCVLLTLVGCSSRSINRAPVEERVTRVGESAGTAAAPKQPQGFENAGKAGYYTVKPGDTLTRIALENGQSPRDIAAWSQVENLNRSAACDQVHGKRRQPESAILGCIIYHGSICGNKRHPNCRAYNRQGNQLALAHQWCRAGQFRRGQKQGHRYWWCGW